MSFLTEGRSPVGSRIAGLGSYLPDRAVGNDEVAPAIGSSDEWIRSRSGIVTRHFAVGESVADMAMAAAGKAVAAAGVDPASVDLVVVSTCSNHRSVPGVAAEVALRIGATGAGAFDVNATCSGFCYALSAASDAVRAGSARRAVVVGAERMSDILDAGDRSTAFLFGDGAGAAVVAPSEGVGIGPVVWGSDGASGHIVAQDPTEDARSSAGLPYLRMDGPAVFRWAVTALTDVAHRACAAAGITPSELAAFVPHQANLRIVDNLARSLRLSADVVVARDAADVGNTSSASVPMALTRIVESGRVPSGSPALLLGFGAGLAYAGQVVLTP